MDFKQLQSFVTVVRCGSFTQAAQQLFISQPTVSAHVRMLEEELGRQLIVRTTKAIEITEKGREICEYAEGILDMRDRMMQACSDTQQRIIHLGASTIPSAYILPQLLAGFGKLHPNIYFNLFRSDSRGVLEGLQSGRFELGLLSKERDDMNCIPVCQDRMVLITPVSNRYLDMKKGSRSPLDDLAGEPIILREKDAQDKREHRFLEEMGVAGDQLCVVARVNDQEAVKNLVAGGVGISFISELAARNFIEEKRVLCFHLPHSIGRMLYLAYKKHVELPAHVRAFIDYVRKMEKQPRDE